MLDNLANVDLSGISTWITYDYSNFGSQIASVLVALAVFIALLLLAFGIYTALTGTKSKKYREFLSDMFVSGRIKQIAKEKSVDLEQEIKEFYLMDKKMKLEMKTLPDVIEAELKMEVAGFKDKPTPKK